MKTILYSIAIAIVVSFSAVSIAQDAPRKAAAAAAGFNPAELKPEKAMDTFNGFFMSTVNSLSVVRDAASAKKARSIVETATKDLAAFSTVSDKLPAILQPLLKESAKGFIPVVKDQLGRIQSIKGAGAELIGPVNKFVKTATAFAS